MDLCVSQESKPSSMRIDIVDLFEENDGAPHASYSALGSIYHRRV